MTWPLVVGLGSHHGDDQAGWLALDRLRERGYPIERLFRARHPAELLDAIDAQQRLVIIDACVGGDSPGTILCFRWPTDRLVYQRPSGSHDLSLIDIMELGQRFGCFPEAADIWTLEGNEWSAGTEPSLEVQSAAARVADAIWEACRDA